MKRQSTLYGHAAATLFDRHSPRGDAETDTRPSVARPETTERPSAPESRRDEGTALSTCLQEYLDRANQTGDPVALLLLAPAIRRPTGQLLDKNAQRAVRQALADLLRERLYASDAIVSTEDGLLGIVLPGTSMVGAYGIANKIHRILGATRVLDGRDVVIRGPIGVSMFPNEGVAPEALVQQARARLQSEPML